MKKKILVFSNGEKIGDGIIKLPLLNEIKRRLPNYNLTWVTNLGKTVFNNELKNISKQYIDEIIEEVNLKPYFWMPISSKYNFSNRRYNFIFDTQKAFYRTFALKRIKTDKFISATAKGFFSTSKIKSYKKRNYYLDDLYNLLDLIKKKDIQSDFKIPIPNNLQNKLENIFNVNYKYIGIAPGAGEKNKIWPLDKFIEVGKFYESKGYKIVLYLGPDEQHLKNRLKHSFHKPLLPEEIINDYSNIEIVIGSTKYLSCALANDSGISHMLSSRYCPLVKLFGPKDSNKFTPKNDFLKTISSKEFNSNEVSIIPVEKVLSSINKFLY